MKRPLSLGFLGSPSISADLLQYLVGECSDLLRVKVVWTNPPKPAGRGAKQMATPVAICAKQLNLPLVEKSSMDQSDAQIIVDNDLDALLIVAYGSLLPRFFFQAPKYGSYNLHFSLLPVYRGASPIQSVILAGEQESGITLQTISEKMDRGDIVMQHPFSIKDKNMSEVLALSLVKSKEMLEHFFKKFLQFADTFSWTPQDETMATYCQKVRKMDGKITSDHTLQLFKRKFLAYVTWPGVYFFVAGEKMEVLLYDSLDFVDIDKSGFSDGLFPRGSFFVDQKKRLMLVLADGIIHILRLKRQGKKVMSADDFINGYRENFPCFIDDI